MEDGGGPTVKLTRLRRRLSVEAEDVKSPSTPSTPTKKRGGRLAAKPQLDFIDEHIPENVPKTRSTRKSIARDIVDEEKPVTPSRRSARIRSNTSIVSETHQNFDSPRAKRAARRLSQAGSDNEGPTTPVRQTRRTRKDSTSSLDKADAIESIKTSPVIDIEVIVEEVENEVKESKENSRTTTPTRSSPRLNNNNGRRSWSSKPDDTERNETQGNVSLNSSINKGESKPLEDAKSNELMSTMSLPVEANQADTPEQKTVQVPNLSIATYNLIQKIDTEPKKTDHNKMNRSLSSSVEVINKRHRTKSWTTINKGSSSDGSFCSDIEISKKKNRNKSKSISLSNTSGDGIFENDEKHENTKNEYNIEKNLHLLLNTSKTTKESSTSIEKAVNNISASGDPNNSFKSITETPKDLNYSNESNKENNTTLNAQEKKNSEISEKLFEETPNGRIQALVYLEDSDSNTGSIGKANTEKVSDEDQCVPVVEHQAEATPSTHNDTCEPMDIDETMPENISIQGFQNISSNSKRKSSLSIPSENETSTNKSKNESMKSSMSISESQNLEKSGNENKSTLILSQIKDLSSNELISKSPKVAINDGSNVVNLPDKGKDLKTLSQNYSTSTPLQQKPNKKLGLPLDSSIISSQESKDAKKYTNVSRKNNGNGTKAENSDSDEDSSDSDDEEPKEKSGMFDDEAEEASENYESGDSQDADERQYEEENEIKEKGETLDSDEDISNDTDYEKDSFIVSSDEEDNELLSGSGDDLSLSDNELNMSAKSKNKFNKRKEKEQKKASKEMYEARHKINNSDKSSKSETPRPKKNNRMRLDSALMDSDTEDVNVPSKKNEQRRIDSSQDTSTKSELDESVCRKKKKTKRLSESMCHDSIINEKEITINNKSLLDKSDPLSLQLKQEPNTPQKDLDISTVLITNVEEVENVNVDENDVTLMNMNELSDPLQATMADNDDSSSSSDNAEIIQNYDSMLSELNNDLKNKRAKLWDTSLNLDKKTKTKSNAPIVDQLNLTVTKKSKKTKASEDFVDSAVIDTRVTTATSKPIANTDEECSSDSIDMRLLFPEDSNDSESAYDKNKTNKDTDEFIPLKRTAGKTDITESLDITIEPKEASILNMSKNNNKKRKSSVCLPEQLQSNNDASQTKEESELNVSTKKDKKRKSSVCPPEEIKPSDDASQTMEESVLNVSKKKDKKRKSSVCPPEEIKLSVDASEITEESVLNVSKKKDKKRKSSVCPPEEIKLSSDEPEFLGFYMDTTGAASDTVPPVDTSLKTSAKKKKNKNKNNSMSTSVIDLEAGDKDNTAEIEEKSDKKRKSKQPLDSEPILAMSDVQAAKTDECNDDDDAPLEIAYHSEKNITSKQVLDMSQSTDNKTDDVPAVLTSKKDKKKNKKNSETAQSDIEVQEKSINSSMTSSGKKKKNKKVTVAEIVANLEIVKPVDVIVSTQSNIIDQKYTEIAVDVMSNNKDDKLESRDEVTSSKKRKRKSSGEPREGDMANASQTLNESLKNNVKKKQKVISNHEVAPAQTKDFDNDNVDNVVMSQEDGSTKKSKKSKQLADQGNILPCAVPVNDIPKRSRKRKERDDDNGSKESKVFKENVCDKVHVSRLPTSLLNQLNDKPKEVVANKKSSPVSTTQFVVEETKKKKSKPSNYLEESIYLNESHIAVKPKASLKVPKVLPFIPTASTSASGFTTNFRVNQIPNETHFIAQSSDVRNFKNDYLQNKRIKKLGTYEMYKKGRNIKLSKF